MIEYENLKLLNQPFLNELSDSALKSVESGWYILGQAVKKFETEFAEYNRSKYCVGVASGLDALILSLRALGIEKGSEVIVPSNTYIATILAVLHADLVPVLSEPDLATYNIDAGRIREKINSRTKAIIVVHLYGKPCEMSAIMDLADQHGLKVIEDCAQAHGAEYAGTKIGNFGHCNAFSFYPTKNLGALGDAGAVVTNDEKIAENVRLLRNYGSKIKYHNQIVGYNSRLDEMQAGFLSVKLKHLDKINAHKRKLADIYTKGLGANFVKPATNSVSTDVFHIFPIRTERRDELKSYLADRGIGTEIHYPLAPHRQQALLDARSNGLMDFRDDEFPISQMIHETILSLPISFFHTEENVRAVISTMNEF